MARYRAVVAYDGTDFLGFQSQDHAGRDVRTVQAVLESCLGRVIREQVAVVGAGRTDAGVHASGQVVHFECGHTVTLAVDDLERAVNAVLPSDVRMFGVAVAGTGFHARFSATKRSYRYTIDNGRYAHPHLRRHAWHVGSPLDLNAMRAACSELIGVHDFVAFASREASGPTVRRVFGANVIDASFEVDEGQGGDRPGGMWQHRVCADPAASSGGGLIWIEVEANAFLRHMMRRIVGSLIRVGRGWMSPADIGSVLRRRVKAEAGPAAPPHGLNLFCVAYGDATVVDQA